MKIKIPAIKPRNPVAVAARPRQAGRPPRGKTRPGGRPAAENEIRLHLMGRRGEDN